MGVPKQAAASPPLRGLGGRMLITVIIPVYGVEKFIEKGAEALMGQTMRDGVEFIFVNDATKDRSIELLRQVIARHSEREGQVRIIEHEQNQGLPAARNTGLAAARGEYIYHCDSDDFVEPDALEKMLACARAQDADIVWTDWWLSFSEKERYMHQPSYSTPIEALRGMLSGEMKYNVWNKLCRRSLYGEDIRFPAGHGMGEDMTMMMLFARAGRVAHLPEALYHYVKLNTGAFSMTKKPSHLVDLKYNVARTEEFMRRELGNAVDDEIAFMKLEAKWPMLLSDADGRRAWRELWPEANAYIGRNRHWSTRTRWVQLAAARGLMFIPALYGWLINKVVYGHIFR